MIKISVKKEISYRTVLCHMAVSSVNLACAMAELDVSDSADYQLFKRLHSIHEDLLSQQRFVFRKFADKEVSDEAIPDGRVS